MRKSWILWTIVSMLAVLTGCVPSTLPRPTPTVISPRQIVGGTLAAREYWRVQGACGCGRNLPHLAATDTGQIVQLHWVFDEGWQIRALDSGNGEMLWATDYGPFISLVSDEERVYVQRMYEIWAYSLLDGQYLWASHVKPRILYNIWVEDDMLFIAGEGELYLLDSRTGKELEHIRLETDDDFPLLTRLGEVDLYKTWRTLRTVERKTGQLLWEVEVGGAMQIHTRPILERDVLLISDEGVVIAIDVRAGVVKWTNRDRPFASNSVVVDGFVYGLDYGARLVQLDIETGQVKGYLQFIPPQLNDSGNCIASGKEMLFVCFDDSAELIALRR